MKRCVLSFEQNVDRDNEFELSGGSSLSRGSMTGKLFYPEMFGHMGWMELMNQMILCSRTESEIRKKDYCKDM